MMINYNIGIQLTKNSEKYLRLISDLKTKKNVNCIHISNDEILYAGFPNFSNSIIS